VRALDWVLDCLDGALSADCEVSEHLLQWEVITCALASKAERSNLDGFFFMKFWIYNYSEQAIELQSIEGE